MKKIFCTILTIAMLCTMLPTSALAFDQYVVYSGQTGCQLTDLQFTQAVNSWLLWDVTFTSECDGRVLTTAADHPNLIGRTAIPTVTYEGTSVSFNGETVESGVTEVVLQAENELIVYSEHTRAEYQILITEETNGLPVVLIDTEGADIPDKIDYVDTAITILGAEMYGGDDIYEAVGGIKLRGNSTMGYDKKPYRIKFDKKQNVFGLGKAKSWVLLANYLDPSALRNEISFNFATRLSAYTAETTGFQVYVPRMRPVEVYLNGEYRGLYSMGDHVQVDSTRIDIDESGDEFDDNDVQLYPEGNVGYYLEAEDPSRVVAEWYSESAYYVTIENTGGTGIGNLYTGNQTEDGELEVSGTGTLDTLFVQIKTPEIPSEEQVAYIDSYLQTVNDLILAHDEAVWDYIDMDSFIDWYLANEIYKNTDSGFLSSIKMHKDKDGKLFMGPVWDFDIGSGAVAYGGMDDPTGWRTRSTERCAWYENLFQMDTFVTAVEQRWADIRDNGIVDQIFTDIDELSAQLGKSAEENYALWHDNYVTAVNNTNWLTVPDVCLNGTWLDQVQYLRSYMAARVQWIDEQFGYAPSSTPAFVNLLDSSVSTSSSQTISINKSFNVQDLKKLYLSVAAQTSFDITFNFDVGSPSLSCDWQSESGYSPFVGVTGDPVAAGTYTDVELDLAGYMPYSSNPDAATITLESITVSPSSSSRPSFNRYSVTVSSLYASNEVQSDPTNASVEIGGQLFINGLAEYGETLTADTTAITPIGASVTYQWYADGTAISGATASTYTPTASELNKTLTVVATGTDVYTGSITSDAVLFEKTTNIYATSQVPTLISKTDTTITVDERDGYEISVDGVNWQTSGEFTDLTPNTLYLVCYRHGEFDTEQAGLAGAPLYVITDVDPAGPAIAPGDVTLDDSVDTADAHKILLHIMGTELLTDEELAIADYNGNGAVSTSDIRAILKAAIGE